MVAESLIADVLEANRALPTHGLAPLTWGNASGIDRDEGLMVIKPSGVAYEQLTEGDMVVVDLDGNVITGPHPPRRPSTDTPTHLVLYRAFEEIGGVVHTHSTWGVAWAQAQREIPLLGTTHADLCACPIPVTRALTDEEIASDYEGATGTTLVELISARGPAELPCALGTRSRAVLLGRDARQGGRGRRHARGGGEDGAPHHAARAGRATAAVRRSATSTTSASTARRHTTAQP